MDYKKLLTEGEHKRIKEQRSKFLAKYFALWHEYAHLDKFMITLSPITNTLKDTLDMKRAFMKIYNNFLSNAAITKESHYFSSIEIGLNKNSGLEFVELKEKSNIRLYDTNYHLHIQLLTTLKQQEIQTLIDRVDYQQLSFHKHLSVSKKKDAMFKYIMKDLEKVDYHLQYLIRRNFPNENLYSSSRGKYPNFVITKIYNYFKQRKYRNKWKAIPANQRYKFISDGFKANDIVIDVSKRDKGKIYDTITIPLYKSKTIKEVYIKVNIL